MTVCRERKMYSEVLGQWITVRSLSTADNMLEVITDDGTVYSPFEVNLLRTFAGKIDPVVHLVKRITGGTIEMIERKED